MTSVAKSFQLLFLPLTLLTGGLSLMDRYITSQLIMPFLFGVGAFSAIAVSIGTLFDLVRKVTSDDLPLNLAIQVFLLRLPEFVVYALPMSTLLAALIAYGRLASDSELIALRGCGISVRRMVVPALILSLAVTGCTFALNEAIAPQTTYQASVLLNQTLKKDRPTYKERDIFYREFTNLPQANGKTEEALSELFYAKQFDGQHMINLTVLTFNQKNLQQIVSAKSAVWNPTQNVWDFFEGTVYAVAPDGSYSSIVEFQQQPFAIARTPLDLATWNKDSNEMNIAEAQRYLSLLNQSADEQTIRKLMVQIQRKYAFPFVCVVFGLIGAVLGSKPGRTNRATGFGLSILIIFVYYTLAFLSAALGQAGAFSPIMAAWLPNIFGFGVGGFLLSRST
jgi:lipopolysaccharide export system permease protein